MIEFRLIALLFALGAAGCAPGEATSPAAPPDLIQQSSPKPVLKSSDLHRHSKSEELSVGADGLKQAPDFATLVNFTDVARERGLICSWPEQPRPMTALDAFGAGCAVFDCDDDGWQDVLLIQDPHPRLFHNRGGGSFAEVTMESGFAAVAGKWTGCAIGDYNGDGLLDVVVTGYHQLALYKNLGEQRFEEATAEAGLDRSNYENWGASAGFMDLDGDRWLDLVVLNYVVFGAQSRQYCEYAPGVRSGCSPREYPSERGRIWRNTGTGRFELVPGEQGMADTHGTALVLGFTDLDGDGRMDFYIGNDGLPADLLHNQGNMQFKNIAFAAGVSMTDSGRAISAMTADWADYDRDGNLDLIVTNWQGSSAVVFRGLGQNLFMDSSRRTDVTWITKNRMGFGGKWVDFENDGWPDVFIVNGHVYDNVSQIQPDVQFRQPIQLLSNQNGRKFIDVVPRMGATVQRALVGRGSATGDFDNDGRVDLLAVDFEGSVMLLQNRTDPLNHWLKLDLRSAPPDHFAYGARVTGRSGDMVWVGEVSPASSYLSSSDPRVHWGLGKITRLETLTIRWPSGREQVLRDVAGDQVLRIVEDPPPNR